MTEMTLDEGFDAAIYVEFTDGEMKLLHPSELYL